MKKVKAMEDKATNEELGTKNRTKWLVISLSVIGLMAWWAVRKVLVVQHQVMYGIDSSLAESLRYFGDDPDEYLATIRSMPPWQMWLGAITEATIAIGFPALVVLGIVCGLKRGYSRWLSLGLSAFSVVSLFLSAYSSGQYFGLLFFLVVLAQSHVQGILLQRAKQQRKEDEEQKKREAKEAWPEILSALSVPPTEPQCWF
jgi:hypothetical protein